MCRELLRDEPAFAAAVAELDPVFVEQAGFCSSMQSRPASCGVAPEELSRY